MGGLTQTNQTNISRIVGAGIMLLCLLYFNTDATTLIQRLVLPVAMGIASGLIVQNFLVAAIAGATLAGIHTDLDGDWINARAYPAIALVSGLFILWAMGQRFASRVRDTREMRWRDRASGVTSQQDNAAKPGNKK